MNGIILKTRHQLYGVCLKKNMIALLSGIVYSRKKEVLSFIKKWIDKGLL